MGARGACRTYRTVWQVWRWSRPSGTAAHAAGVGAGPDSFRRQVWRCLVPDEFTLGGELVLGAGPDSFALPPGLALRTLHGEEVRVPCPPRGGGQWALWPDPTAVTPPSGRAICSVSLVC